MKIPALGMSKQAVADALDQMKKDDLAWRSGRAFAYVYDGGREVEEVGKQAYMAFLTENGLDPTVFPSLLRLENDLVAMARAHLGGDDEVVGNFTSGGTESIMLAVKTARDASIARRPALASEVCEVVLPTTAHAAFFKSAHYLGVKAVPIPVGDDYRADVAAMRAAINDRTILLVGSASSYAHGTVDPIGALSELALEKKLLLHVDGCIGGFLLPYFKKLGASVPDFDFRLPGVTSMSMDWHKYALCPKGASVVLYRNKDLRRHQIYACSSWAGYTMVNNTIQSSKSGGPMAAAWAVLHHVGEEGYLRFARGLLDARDRILAGLAAIADLRVLGSPEMSLIAFTARDPSKLSVFALADAMKARGWYVQPQLAFQNSPANLHLSLQPSNLPWTEPFLADLAAAVNDTRGVSLAEVEQMAAGLAQQLDPSTAADMLPQLLAMAGLTGGGKMPEKMADVNTLLNALPRPLQEKLLVEFVNQMFTPTAG